MADPRDFYNELADLYHLIFEDWDRSISQQGEALASVIAGWLDAPGLVLDVACGIGTQALALALRGFEVIGSDVACRALARARREARDRRVGAGWVGADFRTLPFRTGCAAVALACDNAIPHLPTIDEIGAAISELARCVRPGGGVMISVRDYRPQAPGTRERKPYGEREWNGSRYFAEQDWVWHGEAYTMTLRLRPLDPPSTDPVELSTTYHSVAVEDVLEAMRAVGLSYVRRVDGVFYQPLLIGTVPRRPVT